MCFHTVTFYNNQFKYVHHTYLGQVGTVQLLNIQEFQRTFITISRQQSGSAGHQTQRTLSPPAGMPPGYALDGIIHSWHIVPLPQDGAKVVHLQELILVVTMSPESNRCCRCSAARKMGQLSAKTLVNLIVTKLLSSKCINDWGKPLLKPILDKM